MRGTIKYQFKEVVPVRNARELDPQEVGEVIEDLRKRHGDEDVADHLWRVAQDPKHILHGSYEWDLRKAAEAHWRETSRKIIQTILIVDADAPEGVAPAFVSIRTERGGFELKSMPEIKQSGPLMDKLLEQAKRDLENWTNRYRVFNDIVEKVREAQDMIERRQTRRRRGSEGDRPKA